MATPDVLTGRSVHARLRRDVPVDHEAHRQAAMAAAERRVHSARRCFGGRAPPQAEAGRRLPQEVVLISSGADSSKGSTAREARRAYPTAGDKHVQKKRRAQPTECQRLLALGSQNKRKERNIDPVIKYTYTLRGTNR